MVPLGSEKALFIPQTTIYQPGPTLPVGSLAQTLPGLRQSSLPTSEDNTLRFVLITWPRADKPSLPKAVSKRSTLTCPPTRKEQALKKFNLFLAAHLVDLLSKVGRGGGGNLPATPGEITKTQKGKVAIRLMAAPDPIHGREQAQDGTARNRH